MPNRPTILLTFANDQDAHLDMLKNESHEIYKAIETVKQNEIISIEREESATLEIIINRLITYREDICIFHYSGHASGQHLGLEDGQANSQGIAQLIAALPNLQLVVLNGCATYGQVELLFELGVKAVIATQVAIEDTKATEFSMKFYQALGKKQSVEQAYNTAIGFLKSKYPKFKANKPQRGLKLKREKPSDIEWNLYFQDENVLHWTINQDLKFQYLLRQGSKKYYQKLRNGRYKYLKISDILLSDVKAEWIETEVSIQEQKMPLEASLEQLWQKDIPHTLVKGEGGMGKTVSIIKLWEQYQNTNNWKTPIPIFVALNEYNHTKQPDGFILHYITSQYLGKKRPTDDDFNLIWNILETPLQTQPFRPSVILFLDGMNEVIADNIGLIRELRQLAEDTKGIQIVITSRGKFKLEWVNGFKTIELLPLEEDRIHQYLHENKATIPTDEDLKQLLYNPMMLTLFVDLSELMDKHKENKRFDFKPRMTTYSELMWNFIEAQLVKYFENDEIDTELYHYYKLMLRHILPFIGYYMERQDLFDIEGKVLKTALKEYIGYYLKDDFLDVFEEYEDYIEDYHLKAPKRKDLNNLVLFLTSKVLMMVEENKTYRFLHQHFRDFFTASYIMNDIQISLKQNRYPQSLSERKLRHYNDVRKNIGELCGETYHIENLITNNTFKESLPLLDSLLNNYRGIFNNVSIQIIIWNILEIWNKYNGHLGGLDLSSLDLSDYLFLHRRLSNLDDINKTTFQNSIISSSSIFPKETRGYNSVIYSDDGKYIFTVSEEIIRKWDLLTSERINEFRGHFQKVTDLTTSLDGRYLISVSDDLAIIKWDLEGKICDKKIMDNPIKLVAKNRIGDKIAVGLKNGYVIELNIEKLEITETYRAKFNVPIDSLVYHPKEDYLLYRSYNVIYIIDLKKKETHVLFRIENGRRPRQMYFNSQGTYLLVVDYAFFVEYDVCKRQKSMYHKGELLDAKYLNDDEVISTNGSGEISIWNRNNKNNLTKSEKVHDKPLIHLAVSPDSKYILVIDNYKNLLEFTTKNLRLKTLMAQYTLPINSLSISPNGKKVVVGSQTGYINEWDFETGKCINSTRIIIGELNYIHHLDSKNLICASKSEIIHWDIFKQQLKSKTDTWIPGNLKVHPVNSNKILFTEHSEHIGEWDLNKNQKEHLKVFPEKIIVIKDLAYNHDGSEIIIAHSDHLSIINSDKLEEVKVFGGKKHYLNTLAVDKNGQYIYSGGKKGLIVQWNRSIYDYQNTYKGHSKSITSIDCSSCSSYIVSSSQDFTIRLWDIKSSRCLHIMAEHKGIVNAVKFNQDGKSIISISDDGSIKIWETATGKCIKTLYNIPELNIQGVDFRNLHPDSNFTKEDKEIMRQYGAIFNDKDKEEWEELQERLAKRWEE